MKSSTIILTIFSLILSVQCSKDETKKTISIDQKSLTMFSGDTTQLNLIFSTEDLKGKIYQWTTTDKNVSTVSSSGLVTGVRIGETYITATTSDASLMDSAKITIQPKYNLYREPHLVFGASLAAVKAYETRELKAEANSELLYKGENENVRFVEYLFDNNVMSTTDVMLATNDVSDYLIGFIIERYEPLMQEYMAYYFTNNKGVIAVLNYNEILGLNVLYLEDSNLKSTLILKEEFKMALMKIRQKMLQSEPLK